MHRFAPALRRVARELELPRGARAAILQELAADLDAVYAHHRARGVEEAEAQERAEESVLGTTDVVRRLARLHRRSWRGWSESMATRLSGGIDLLMLLLGVVPMLAAAALFAIRTAGGLLVWITAGVGVLITVTIGRGVMRAARGWELSSWLLESLLVCGGAACALGVLGALSGLQATSAYFASGPLTSPSAADLSARLARDGSVLVLGLLLAIAALFAWFLLVGRDAARLSAEVDALLGPAETAGAGSVTVIPLTSGRSA